jgi:putative transposase
MNNLQLIQAYKDEKNVKVKERLFLIKQVLLDKQIASHVAKSLGRVRSWAYKWIERFNEFGINGLHDLPRTGRPTSIPEKKLISIEQQIAENPSGWSAKQVMNLIYEKSGVKYHEVHVYRLLHKWGYTSKVAQKRFVNSATMQEKLWFKKTLKNK